MEPSYKVKICLRKANYRMIRHKIHIFHLVHISIGLQKLLNHRGILVFHKTNNNDTQQHMYGGRYDGNLNEHMKQWDFYTHHTLNWNLVLLPYVMSSSGDTLR